MNPERLALRTVIASLASSLALAVGKITAGWLGHSFALIADGVESATDMISSLLVLLGLSYAKRPADENHPYGHGRMESLVTFGVVMLLALSASLIAIQSIYYIRTPHPLPEAWTLWVLGGIIIWKEGSFQWVARKARQTQSTALLADAWHHRSDAITTVAAFSGILIALWLGSGYESADDWAALIAAGLIYYNSYRILRPVWEEVMDEQVYPELIARIREISAGTPGILGTEKCFVRKTGMYYYADLHAQVDGGLTVSEGHALAHALENALKAKIPALKKVLVHVEPYSPAAIQLEEEDGPFSTRLS